VLTAASRFGHREIGGIVVDLFWNRGNLGDEFRVEVEDKREGFASFSAQRPGETRSRPSTTRSRLRSRGAAQTWPREARTREQTHERAGLPRL
jgi:hypothetical protein